LTRLERLALGLLHRLDPERAHGLSIGALRAGLVPLGGVVTSNRLQTTLAGLAVPNPVGLAAGFDKNATALAPLCRAGFGFVEVGAATPQPQAGNPKPRLFRLSEDRAAINRFGFNNEGASAIAARLAAHPRGPVPVGLNLGANKTSTDRAADFARVLAVCGPHVDFATVNVSSPNTERLRDLQGPAALTALLAGVMDTRARLARPIPIFLKIAPDLDPEELAQLAEVALASGLDGIVATNTTLSRTGLKSEHSGQMAHLSKLTEGRIPLIGVGGISDADQAYAKIRAGASAVQLYTALVYHGLSLGAEIARGLDRLLARDGHANVAAAVGSGRDDWL
jgi:dihydroorotate dehydrogenase